MMHARFITMRARSKSWRVASVCLRARKDPFRGNKNSLREGGAALHAGIVSPCALKVLLRPAKDC